MFGGSIPVTLLSASAKRWLVAAAVAAVFAAAGLFLVWARHTGTKAAEQAHHIETLQESLRVSVRANAAAQEALRLRALNGERIRTVTKEIIREVPVRIPAGACPLPDEWRVLHDAAAAGAVPAPPGGPDASPTAPEEAASTVADNYGQYHDIADQLERLQQWVKGVSQ